MEIDTTTRFQKFLSMTGLFKPASKKIVQKTYISEEEYLRQAAAFAAETAQAELANSIAESKKMITQLFDQAFKNKDIHKVRLILQRGYQLNLTEVDNILSDKEFSHKEDKYLLLEAKKQYNIHLKYGIDEQVQNIVNYKTLDFSGYRDLERIRQVWHHFDKLKDFKDKEYALSFKENIDKVIQFLSKNPEHYRHTSKFVNHCKMISTHIYNTYTDVYLDEFSQELDKYQAGFHNFDTIKQHIEIGLRDNVKRLKAIDLPQASQTIISEITKVAQEAALQKLTTVDSLEFENMYKKRLPQVIEEYISISPRYREKLKGHNEDPEVILLDSLTEIKSKIVEIIENVDSQKHHQQKITQQYLRNK